MDGLQTINENETISVSKGLVAFVDILCTHMIHIVSFINTRCNGNKAACYFYICHVTYWKQLTGYIPGDLQARHVKYVLNQIKANQSMLPLSHTALKQKIVVATLLNGKMPFYV